MEVDSGISLLLRIEALSVSFLKIQSLQESRFQEPNNYKSSRDRKILKNDCQNHKTQMGIRLVTC